MANLAHRRRSTRERIVKTRARALAKRGIILAKDPVERTRRLRASHHGT